MSNGCARALKLLVDFFAQILRCPENVKHDGCFLKFYLKCFALSQIQFRGIFDTEKQREITSEYRKNRR